MKEISLYNVWEEEPCIEEWDEFVKTFASKYGWTGVILPGEVKNPVWEDWLRKKNFTFPSCEPNKGDVVEVSGNLYLVSANAVVVAGRYDEYWTLTALTSTPGNYYGNSQRHIQDLDEGKVIGKFFDVFQLKEGKWKK